MTEILGIKTHDAHNLHGDTASKASNPLDLDLSDPFNSLKNWHGREAERVCRYKAVELPTIDIASKFPQAPDAELEEGLGHPDLIMALIGGGTGIVAKAAFRLGRGLFVEAATLARTRTLTAADFEADALHYFNGTFHVKDGVATVYLRGIHSELSSSFSWIRALKDMARAKGAHTLEIKAWFTNEKLRTVLARRYGMTTVKDNVTKYAHTPQENVMLHTVTIPLE